MCNISHHHKRLTCNQFKALKDAQAQTKTTKGKQRTIPMYTKHAKYDSKNTNNHGQPMSFNIQNKNTTNGSITSRENSKI